MADDDTPARTGLAEQLMRQALLRELQREVEAADGQVTTKLQLIARRLVDKAADGDIQSTKEIHDRIDGKSLPCVARADQEPVQRTVQWKDYPSSSTMFRGRNSSPSTSDPNVSPAS